MNKTKLAKQLALRMSVTEVQAQQFINTFQAIVGEELLKEESVVFKGFGSFSLWQQTERSGRNPMTGAPALIPARKSVKFKPGRWLLKTLNS